jgi:hypothetical protein
MPIKVRTTDGFNAGLTAGTNIPGNGSPSVSSVPLTHKDIDNNLKSVYPVGSIYINVASDQNPKQLIGFGNWKPFGRRKILVGKNDSPWSGDGDPSIFSRKILSAEALIENAPFLNGAAEIDGILQPHSLLRLQCYPDNSPFSVGQKVTIKGLTQTGGKTIANRERRIVQVYPNSGTLANRIVVDFSSPSSNVNDTEGVRGSNASISTGASATVTLFGTLYSNVSPNMEKGMGGELSHNLIRKEIPSHSHNVGFEANNTNNNSDSDGQIDYKHRPATTGAGLDNVTLSGRAFAPGQGTRKTSTMKGFAHSNLMPFTSAYFWIRES